MKSMRVWQFAAVSAIALSGSVVLGDCIFGCKCVVGVGGNDYSGDLICWKFVTPSKIGRNVWADPNDKGGTLTFSSFDTGTSCMTYKPDCTMCPATCDFLTQRPQEITVFGACGASVGFGHCWQCKEAIAGHKPTGEPILECDCGGSDCSPPE